MISIDGSYLEGGGQIVRTALALSALTQKPFEVTNIRQGRVNPGLKNQHLYCIKALQQLTDAETEGAELGSKYLKFTPKKLKPKNLVIDIQTAGSISLLMQSVLLPLCFGKKSKIEIIGGTDTKFAMPIDFFSKVLVRQYKRLADIKVKLLRRGYYPKGQGKVVIEIRPKYDFENIEAKQIDLTEQKKLLMVKGISHASSNLENRKVAERQAKIVKQFIKQARIRSEYQDTLSTGSGLVLWALFGNEEVDFSNPIILGADTLGERGLSAEKVGENAAKNLLKDIESKACVDKHMADNMIPLMGLLQGKIKTSKITNHTKTNIWVTEKFLDCSFDMHDNLITCHKIYK